MDAAMREMRSFPISLLFTKQIRSICNLALKIHQAPNSAFVFIAQKRALSTA
jgi:RNase P protein component